MPRDQGAHGRRDDQSRHEPDGERVRVPRGPAHPAAQGVGAGQQRPGVGQQLAPGRGQLGGPLVAHEKLRLELGLQRPDLPGEHRLGDVQRLGGPAEVQPLGYRDEITHLPQIHVHQRLLVR